MKQYNNVSFYKNNKPCVLTIGTFDGVHKGHKAILKKVVDSAKNQNIDSVLLTFFPHPRMVLQKDAQIKLLNTIEERKNLVAKTGIDHLVIHPFTKEFSRLSALEYVRDILVDGLQPKKIIIGYDHSFGRNRTAGIQELKEYGETFDFEVEEISAQEIDNIAVSSTKIRAALTEGDVNKAQNYLGYSYKISGTVIQGRGVGRTLDYPTANLFLEEPYKLVPKEGVYLVRVHWENETFYGLTNIGTNPTVGGTQKTIETHVLDFSGNLYDQNLTIEFLDYLREEQKFESVIQLQEAIKNDEAQARTLLENHEKHSL